MRVLAINSGSSSIKFRVMDVFPSPAFGESDQPQSIIQGSLKGIGRLGTLEISEPDTALMKSEFPCANHEKGFELIFDTLKSLDADEKMSISCKDIEAVGHRVVHGGNDLCNSTLIDKTVLRDIEKAAELAPLHNPACLAGIYGAQALFGESIPMIAVFDTTLYHTLPAYAATYAIPFELAERHHIRRYGFHGIAHASLAMTYAKHSGRDLSNHRLITIQLGNGCSMTAMANGQAMDTSMGFTPCEGLIMGTRSGDLDPSIMSYLAKKEQVPVIGVGRWLNEHSGLLGISGLTNDMPQLLHASVHDQDPRAKLAIDMFCYRIQKYLGAYCAVLGGADAVVFGGGIGEGSPDVRSQICEPMAWCGLKLDKERNHSVGILAPGNAAQISPDGSDVTIYVVGTDEESWIGRETVRCLQTPKMAIEESSKDIENSLVKNREDS